MLLRMRTTTTIRFRIASSTGLLAALIAFGGCGGSEEPAESTVSADDGSRTAVAATETTVEPAEPRESASAAAAEPMVEAEEPESMVGEIAAATLTGPAVQALYRSLQEQLNGLRVSLQQDGAASSTNALEQGMDALGGGNDLQALQLMSGFDVSGLSAAQQETWTGAKRTLMAYVLERNFGAEGSGYAEIASRAADAVQNGNWTQALPDLANLARLDETTPEQKSLIDTMLESYAPGVARTRDAINSTLNRFRKPTGETN